MKINLLSTEGLIEETMAKIKNNVEFIKEVQDMIGTDYCRHRSRMESAISENKYLNQILELLEYAKSVGWKAL